MPAQSRMVAGRSRLRAGAVVVLFWLPAGMRGSWMMRGTWRDCSW